MKKLLCVVLAIVLVMSMTLLTGCAPKDPFLGDWTVTIDLAEAINAEFAKEPEAAEYLKATDFTLVLNFSFKEDGTFSIFADEASCTTAMNNLKEDLKKGMENLLVDSMKDSGLDMTIDQILALAGTTLDALIEEAFDEEDFEEILTCFDTEGKYEAKDGKLFTGEGDDSIDLTVYETYEVVNNNEIHLTQLVGDVDEETKDMAKFIYPMVLKKK